MVRDEELYLKSFSPNCRTKNWDARSKTVLKDNTKNQKPKRKKQNKTKKREK